MDNNQRCVICEGANGAVCRTFNIGSRDGLGFVCEACGEYEVSRSALLTWFSNGHRLTKRQRAALSHQVRVAERSANRPTLTTDWLERFVADMRPPSPAMQAANFIRVIGDYQSETGEGYFIDGVRDAPLVGSFNQPMFDLLLQELIKRGVFVRLEAAQRDNPRGAGVLQGSLLGLSLDGWELYEAERTGKISGRYGFLAMKFADAVLDDFAERVIKASVNSELGYIVVDLRNVSRAGVIDNILREQIRDAAFVLVDLTHDNAGAYWEAGYAEGLGKPVIYLCERTKFDSAKTHFDTNHCTTVLWSTADEAQFSRELIATLRRSLNLFAKEEGAI